MPTENHIIIDKGVSLHPETNTGQVYDYANAKWLDQTIADLQAKPSTWDELQGKPTSFPPSSHTHTVSQITDFPDPYELPTASTTVLGGIKPDGTTITVDPVTGVASASSGSSQEENWIPATLENSWQTGTISNNEMLRYYKSNEGRVYIHGEARKTSSTSNRIFTLPEGYRPTLESTFTHYSLMNNTSNVKSYGGVALNRDGSVNVYPSEYATLDRIYFDFSFRAV